MKLLISMIGACALTLSACGSSQDAQYEEALGCYESFVVMGAGASAAGQDSSEVAAMTRAGMERVHALGRAGGKSSDRIKADLTDRLSEMKALSTGRDLNKARDYALENLDRARACIDKF